MACNARVYRRLVCAIWRWEMGWRMACHPSCPFAEIPGRERENTRQGSRGIEEQDNNPWASPPSPLAERLLYLKGGKRRLFFRLDRQRARYFSDVGNTPQSFLVDEQPTQRSSARRSAIADVATQPERMPLTAQPIRLRLHATKLVRQGE